MIRYALAAAALAAASSSATAAEIDFTIDVGSSYVTLLDQTGGGINCDWSNCGVTAALASGFGGSFSLGEGGTEVFDFITFGGDGTTGNFVFPDDRDFTIEAKLAFSSPSTSVLSGGSGGAFLLGGYIVAGSLYWDDVPVSVYLSDGSMVTVDFQGGHGILLEGDADYTTWASVTVDAIASPAAVPLPAGALLLIGGLGALTALRKRKA